MYTLIVIGDHGVELRDSLGRIVLDGPRNRDVVERVCACVCERERPLYNNNVYCTTDDGFPSAQSRIHSRR